MGTPKSRCPVSSCNRLFTSKHSMKAHMVRQHSRRQGLCLWPWGLQRSMCLSIREVGLFPSLSPLSQCANHEVGSLCFHTAVRPLCSPLLLLSSCHSPFDNVFPLPVKFFPSNVPSCCRPPLHMCSKSVCSWALGPVCSSSESVLLFAMSIIPEH